MPDVTTFAVALQLGAAGAYEDVSAYLESEDEFTRSWGLVDPFDDVAPGSFAFTLANADGRFTPGNPLSPYFATLSEGVGVSWQTNSRIVYGTVVAIEPVFPSDGDAPVAAWGQVRVTVSDALGPLARTRIAGDLTDAQARSDAYYYWPLTDALDSLRAAEIVSNREALALPVFVPNVTPVFESEGSAPVAGTGLLVTTASGTTGEWGRIASESMDTPYISYPAGTLGSWGYWFEIRSGTSVGFNVRASYRAATGVAQGIAFGVTRDYGAAGDRIYIEVPGATDYTAVTLGAGPHYLSAQVLFDGTYITVRPTLDGVALDDVVGTTDCSQFDAPVRIRRVGVYDYTVSDASVNWYSQLSHTILPVLPFAGVTTITDRLLALARVVPRVTFDTPSSDLSDRAIAVADDVTGSVLANLGDLMLVEGGRVYPVSSGTLTSPTTEIVARPKGLARPTSVAYTFDREEDLDGAPEFIRDLANRVSQVTADSGTTQVVATNTTLVNQIGVVAETITAPAYDSGILRNIAEDRIRRGNITDLRVQTITVDARTTSADRWADLLALEPGDRIQITGLPSTQLGYSTWDGWFIGATEKHTTTENLFTLYLEPCLPTFKYGTAVYGAGGTLTLSSGCTSSATSLSVATTALKLTTTNLPQNIVVDREIMTVTAATSGTPQTLTVTRAQGGTLAFAHSAGATVELSPTPVYSY